MRRRQEHDDEMDGVSMTWTLPKAETLALPIDALALLILRDYKAGDGWNWQNWMRSAEQLGTARDREIGRALAEGWSWLMTHGLVVRAPSQPSADAYLVSRLGDETLRYGVGKLAAAERLGMALHPRIAQLVEQQFLLGEYDVAVFVAMREVEIRVRALTGASDSDLGTKLMDKAFAPGLPGRLIDKDAEGGEQQAMLNLFKGAIGMFKNPTSHRAVEYEDPKVASDAVLLADLLLRLLDGIEARLRV